MKIKELKYKLVEQKSADKRKDFIENLITSKRNKTLEINNDYYDGNHWNTDKDGQSNQTRSGKYVWGKSMPRKKNAKDDKLDRFSGVTNELKFHKGQLQKRNFVKYVVHKFQDFITGQENESITVTWEEQVSKDLTKDENQAGSFQNANENGNVNQDTAKESGVDTEAINAFLKVLWKKPENFMKKQTARMIVDTVAINELVYDADEEEYYVEAGHAEEIFPVYKGEDHVGTVRAYMISKEEAKGEFDIEVQEDDVSYAEAYWKEKDDVYMVKFINGEKYIPESMKETDGVVKLTADEKINFDPFDVIPNREHPKHKFDENNLADSEIFELIEQNDSYNAQRTIEHITNLFLAMPKVSIDWDTFEKLGLDVDDEAFKQALQEFQFLPNTLDTLPIKVHEGKGIPESFYVGLEHKEKAMFEDASIPMVLASGNLPANLAVETLKIATKVLDMALKQKREALRDLIRKTSMKALVAKGLIKNETEDIDQNIQVGFPTLGDLDVKDLIEFFFQAGDRGWLPDDYLIQESLDLVGRHDDVDKVISIRNQNRVSILSAVQEEKDRIRAEQVARIQVDGQQAQRDQKAEENQNNNNQENNNGGAVQENNNQTVGAS